MAAEKKTAQDVQRRRVHCGCVVDEKGKIKTHCGTAGHKPGIKHPSGKTAGGEYAAKRAPHHKSGRARTYPVGEDPRDTDRMTRSEVIDSMRKEDEDEAEAIEHVVGVVTPANATLVGAKPVDEALLDAKEDAARDLDRYAEQTWKDYNIQQTVLDAEIVKGVPIRSHIAKRRDAILAAGGLAALGAALLKGKRSVHNVALFCWAKGWTIGPATGERLEKHARRAEALASHLENLGDGEAADKQRARAESIRSGVVPQKVVKVERPLRPCICGCGKTTRGSFAPGHDSKVHSLVLKLARGKEKGLVSKEVIEYVKQSKWLDAKELLSFLQSQPHPEENL